MELVTIFYQAEGLASVEMIDVEREETIASLRDALHKKHAWAMDVILFVEDTDEAIDETLLVRDLELPTGTKLHAHRCRRVDVAVAYNGRTISERYAPSATIARITRHAAVVGFGMSEEAAAEHALQIKATASQPSPGTHVGALVHHPECHIAFDLVPKVRVQGAPGVGH
jgi:hypothetical protein